MQLVSIEGLPGTFRDAVAKAVQAKLGAVPLHDAPAAAAAAKKGDAALVGSLAFLLNQARALRTSHAAAVVVSHASWLDKAPEPCIAKLYADLAGALRRRLGLGGVHRMVYLRTDPHEAFEAVIEAGAECRDVGLKTLLDLRARLDACASPGCAMADTLFPASVHVVRCPKFAVDAPGGVARAADEVLRYLRTVTASPPGTFHHHGLQAGGGERAEVDQDAQGRVGERAAGQGDCADPAGGVQCDQDGEQVLDGVDL